MDNDFYSFSPNGFGMKLSSQAFEKGRNGLRVLERPRRLRARRLPKFSPQKFKIASGKIWQKGIEPGKSPAEEVLFQ